MSNTDDARRKADVQIRDILVEYGEDPATSVWRVQGTAVILHKALERIAAKADIRFDAPTILRAERDEAVILVTGHINHPDRSEYRTEWSIGEAAISVEGTPGNYKVSGKQAAYPYAMAEKRGKDRVILKLINLSGLLYSEEEADEFKEERPAANGSTSNDRQEQPPKTSSAPKQEAPQLDYYGSAINPKAHYTPKMRPRGNGEREKDAATINAIVDALTANAAQQPDPDKLKAWLKGQTAELKRLPDVAFDEVMDAVEDAKALLVAGRIAA